MADKKHWVSGINDRHNIHFFHCIHFPIYSSEKSTLLTKQIKHFLCDGKKSTLKWARNDDSAHLPQINDSSCHQNLLNQHIYQNL